MRTLLCVIVLLLWLPGKASAVWVSVSGDVIQIQHVCPDGVVADLASQVQGPRDVQIWAADPAMPNPAANYFYTGRKTIQQIAATPDVPQMRDPLRYGLNSLGRNHRYVWNTHRPVGSEVVIAAGYDIDFDRYQVENCSAAKSVFDPFTVGYVWADQPAKATYQPSAFYSYNSRMLTNTITRVGVGAYAVEFPGLAGTGGTAHVSAFGWSPAHCKIGPFRWYVMGTAVRLDVRCFSPAGTPMDARFTASYNGGYGSANTMAFAWADHPGVFPYTAYKNYQYNNQGGLITVTRVGKEPGYYDVVIPNNYGPRAAGTVKVTAVGKTAVACKAEKFWPSGTAQVVRVRCSAPSGALVDEQFTVAYMDGMNVVGNNLMSDGYVLADQPLANDYTPTYAYQRNTAHGPNGTVTISRDYAGAYDVLLPLQDVAMTYGTGTSWDGGTVHVTAYGSDTARCQVGYWQTGSNGVTTGRVARIYCFTTAGVLTDAKFTLQYTAQIK